MVALRAPVVGDIVICRFHDNGVRWILVEKSAGLATIAPVAHPRQLIPFIPFSVLRFAARIAAQRFALDGAWVNFRQHHAESIALRMTPGLEALRVLAAGAFARTGLRFHGDMGNTLVDPASSLGSALVERGRIRHAQPEPAEGRHSCPEHGVRSPRRRTGGSIGGRMSESFGS
jgi:hypothetical protein